MSNIGRTLSTLLPMITMKAAAGVRNDSSESVFGSQIRLPLGGNLISAFHLLQVQIS